jgi:transposase-like protein
MERAPRTLVEAVRYFSDPDVAHAYAVKLRWPNGIACPRHGCGNADPARIQAIPTRRIWRCKECKRQFSVRVGTIWEDSPIPFSLWLPAIWLLANAKNGISSHELGRALGVTQKTAWFMLHRIRIAMRARSFAKLEGEVEADETYVGGVRKTNWVSKAGFKKLQHGPGEGKTTVFGVIQRGTKEEPSQVRAMVVPDRSSRSLVTSVREHVLAGSVLYTDAWGPYRQLKKDYVHLWIDHFVSYCQGRVHTNGIENFWNCLKRMIQGTYLAPRPWHLHAYVDEEVFRFNERKDNDAGRFDKVLRGVDGRRITYAQLTGSSPTWRLKPGRAARALARLNPAT